MLSCEHCREELAEYALGHVTGSEAAAIDEHLAACVVCRRELAQVESAWSGLALALPPAAPRSEVFERLMERIETDDGVAPRLRRETKEPPAALLTPRQRLWSYVLAASLLGALVGGALYLNSAEQAGAPADALAEEAVRDLAERLGNLQQLERMLAAGNVKLTSIGGPSANDASAAYVVWDRANRQWHVYALGLPTPPAGKTYQLWAVIGDEAPLPGPTFDVDAAGIGGVIADFPALSPATAVKAVITLEPAGGSQAPTSAPVLEAPL